MRTPLKHITSVLLFFALFVSCDKDTPGHDMEAETILTIHTSLSPLNAQGESIIIQFTSSVAWSASIDQSWCSLSTERGEAGTVSITLSAPQNNTYNERNATFTLKAGDKTERLTITQKQKDALIITSNKIEIPAQGGEISVEVKANISFNYQIAETDKEWIKPLVTGTLTTTLLKFEVKPNEAISKREGTITIVNGEFSETVTIYQAGAKPSLVLTKNAYTVKSEGDDITIELQSNVPYQMKLPQVDWLREPPALALSTYTHHITVSPNNTYDNRTAEIIFVNESSELADTVRITQMQKNAILVAQTKYDVPAKAGSLNFEINTNVEFDVTIAADWIRLAPATCALKTVPLNFIIDANPDAKPRETIITFSDGSLIQTVKVIQTGRKDSNRISITHTNRTYQIPTLTGDNLSGIIRWGDGETGIYQLHAAHTYPNNGQRTVIIETLGAEEITFSNLTGVTEMDLTEF